MFALSSVYCPILLLIWRNERLDPVSYLLPYCPYCKVTIKLGMVVNGWRSIGLIGVFNMTLTPFVSYNNSKKGQQS
jgi:hypothetical protein